MNTDNIQTVTRTGICNAITVLKERGLLLSASKMDVGDYYHYFARNLVEAFRYADRLGAIELTEMMMQDSPFIADWYAAILLRDRTVSDSAAMLAGILMECVNEPAEAHRIIHHFTK